MIDRIIYLMGELTTYIFELIYICIFFSLALYLNFFELSNYSNNITILFFIIKSIVITFISFVFSIISSHFIVE